MDTLLARNITLALQLIATPLLGGYAHPIKEYVTTYHIFPKKSRKKLEIKFWEICERLLIFDGVMI